MVFGKDGHPLVQQGILVVLDERRAGAQALLRAAGGHQRYGADAVVHQFAGQLAARHARIADGEVEAVGHGLAQVVVVDQPEAMAQEDFLQPAGAFAVDAHLVQKVVAPVAGSLQHGGQGILGRVARARRQGVEHAVDEDRAERARAAIALHQARVGAVVEFVRDAAHADALSGVAERLRAGDEQDVVVRVACYGGLEWRLERAAQVLAEVHCEVGEVFQHDDVVLCGQSADDAQLLVLEAHPAGVVRVGVDDGGDVSTAQVAFQLLLQAVAAIVVDVERLIFLPHHHQLLLLYGKSGVDEEDGVLARVALAARQERGERPLHRARHRHAAFGRDVHVDKRLDEARCLPLQLVQAVDVRIQTGDAVPQGFDFGFHANGRRRQSGHAHFHFDELDARLGFSLGRDGLHFSDGGSAEIGHLELIDRPVDDISFDRSSFHVFRFWYKLYMAKVI